MEQIMQFGLSGVVAFGAVGVLTRFMPTTATQKLALLVAVAFGVGFVPADLGNEIMNRFKEALATGLGIHAIWTGLKQFGHE